MALLVRFTVIATTAASLAVVISGLVGVSRALDMSRSGPFLALAVPAFEAGNVDAEHIPKEVFPKALRFSSLCGGRASISTRSFLFAAKYELKLQEKPEPKKQP